MWFLILVGILAFIFGLLFLFSPRSLENLSTQFNKVVSFEKKILELRIGVGISLLLASVLCFFVVYYLMKKYG